MFVDMARKNLVKLTFGELCRTFVPVLEYSISSSETRCMSFSCTACAGLPDAAVHTGYLSTPDLSIC